MLRSVESLLLLPFCCLPSRQGTSQNKLLHSSLPDPMLNDIIIFIMYLRHLCYLWLVFAMQQGNLTAVSYSQAFNFDFKFIIVPKELKVELALKRHIDHTDIR